ncbi:helix-turn-helix transcriptional regulator [Streptomyces sp. NPDC085614]|uniref:helix-turn-helix transcriptional regulator n=1 Tax=Streptomyces sp. NPDC085614 TaxID=3365733 RepID=UPI0037D036DB
MDLLERDAELEDLAGAVEEARSGKGGFLVIEGPAGIGKTRLLTEARKAAAGAKMNVLAARGSTMERAFAFGVVRQLFESTLASASPGERIDLLSGPAEQAIAVLEQAPLKGTETGELSSLHGLFWFTSNLCSEQPAMLIIDDLQWSDMPSLRFLAYLLPRLEDMRLLVVSGTRPQEPGVDWGALAQISEDPHSTVLHPMPLSKEATYRVMGGILNQQSHPKFFEQCYADTMGNPLFAIQLAQAISAEGLAPSEDNAVLVHDLGSSAVGSYVSLRLAQLPEQSAELARALALLGADADLSTAASVADLSMADAQKSADLLERVDIIKSKSVSTGTRTEFVHPLVRAAIYDEMDPVAQFNGHSHAAEIFIEEGDQSEHAAAHLLQIPPCGNLQYVEALRNAARDARTTGSPDSAFSYLERCLQEPPPSGQRLEVLTELGMTSLMVDMRKAAGYLEEVLDLTSDGYARASIARTLGEALFILGENDKAVAVWAGGVKALPAEDNDLRLHLEAGLISVPFVDPGRKELLERVADLRKIPPSESWGGKTLDGLISLHDTFSGNREAVTRARRALKEGVLVENASGQTPVVCAWQALLAADLDEAMDSIETAVVWAHQHGSIAALPVARTFKALGWLWRGDLAEAENDARLAVRDVETARVDISRPFTGPYLASVLMEQGRIDEAEIALNWSGIPDPPPPMGPIQYFLEARARLLRLKGKINEALDGALATGERYLSHGGKNPAIVAWRSEAALCLHALGRKSDAIHYAREELALARSWGAPRALGHALRITGLVEGGSRGRDLLEEAVVALEGSPARLEYAKALADFGAALRRANHRAEARSPLRQAMILAFGCGATPVVEYARAELTAAGGRPRHIAPTGSGALTPSEKRVAELAAGGATNRQIAQQLFVTPKTVEVHLSAAYRKLGINARAMLPEALKAS